MASFDTAHDDPILDFSHGFMPVVRDYAAKQSIRAGFSGCDGQCAATIRAPALVVDSCQSEVQWINFSRALTPQETKAVYDGGNVPPDLIVFEANFYIRNGTSEHLEFSTGRPISSYRAVTSHAG